MSLKDQVVLVTGSSGGIGDAAVSAFTAAGATVIGADRSAKDDQTLDAFTPSTSPRNNSAQRLCRTSRRNTAASMSSSMQQECSAPPLTSWRQPQKNSIPF